MSPTPRILLVDDDPSIRSSLQFSLELEGFEVETYASSEAAVALAELKAVDCMIIDYRLPGIDGLSFLDLLRSRGFRAPAVLITSNPSRALRSRAATADARVIEKPLLCDALVSALRDSIESAPRAA